MQTVYTAANAMEAHQVRDMLASAGVDAAVIGEILAGVVPEVPFIDAYPKVQVRDEDVERAAALIDEARQQADQAASQPPAFDWACPNCGQRIEGQFTACWHCGAVRPGE